MTINNTTPTSTHVPAEVQKLVDEDLARSGLTLADLDAEALNHFGVQRVLGLEHTPGASGGYAIPYKTITGDPIIEDGLPFVRVRLVGPHSNETPRYLSRGGSTSHLYIPKQLMSALSKSRTLLITEGEKKSVRACKAGFPTVAISGIQMFRDSQNKKKLLPELADLLKGLYSPGTIDTVIVLFDSDGHPISKSKLPSNEKVANSYDEFKNGSFVKNKDVFRAALDLSGLIRQTVNGLVVSHAWCEPLFLSEIGGPKGGKTRTVQHRGLDDVLQDQDPENGGIQTVQNWIDDAMEKAQRGDGEGGYLPLGSGADHKSIWLWSKHQNTLIDATTQQLSTPTTIAALTGMSWLSSRYRKVDKMGNVDIDTKKAGMDIAADCVGRGKFRVEGRVFGTGTWQTKDGTLVVNTAADVYDASNGESLPRIDETMRRREIYTDSGSYPPPAHYRHISDEDYKAVIEKIRAALKQWTFTSAVGDNLILGWLVTTVFLGAMQSRPHLWLVAPRGSGKSHLARFMKSCLGGYAWHTDQGKESTAAGIRQMLQLSSSPCILDEMEKDNTNMSTKSENAAAAILEMMRSAYTATSEVKKGTVDHSGRSFHLMTSFCCVSIADPAIDPADLTRIVKIYLNPIDVSAGHKTPPAMLSEEESEIFFWGTVRRWDQYKALFDEVRSNWREVAGPGDHREIDSFGVLLAAAFTAGQLPVRYVRKNLDNMIPHLQNQIQETRETSNESDLILAAMLSLQIDVQSVYQTDNGEHVSRQRMPISRAIQVARMDKKSPEATALADVGIAVRRKDNIEYLAVPRSNPELQKLFSGTRWRGDGAWAGGLRNVDGAIWDHVTTISGQTKRCVWVPMSATSLEDPENADTETLDGPDFDAFGSGFPSPRGIM